MDFALAYPEAVEKLVLIDAQVGFCGRKGWIMWQERVWGSRGFDSTIHSEWCVAEASCITESV
jgi:hypothetical protein